VSVDELIATLPAQVVESMSALDIEALASGDPQAVARIFLPEAPDGNTEDSAAAAHAETAAPHPDHAPERISLRGLPAQDRIALADMVRAVKDGRFASLDEARSALHPSPAAQALPRAEDSASSQPFTPAVEQVLHHMAHLQALQQEAARAYDTATLLNLNEHMAQASVALRQAQAAGQSAQQTAQHWAQEEAQHMASVRRHYAAELAEPEFNQALLSERDLAEYRGDSVLHLPDWPLRLAERVQQRTHRPAGSTTRSQARARGMVATPSARGAASLSRDEAFDQIEGLTEAEVDAVLSQLREREQASRFVRI